MYLVTVYAYRDGFLKRVSFSVVKKYSVATKKKARMNSWQMFLKSFKPVQVCDITIYKWLLLGRQIEPLTIAECPSVPISARLAPIVLLPAKSRS